MNTKPNAICDGLDAVRQTSLDLYTGRGLDHHNLVALHHRHFTLGQDRQMVKGVCVLQDGRACGDNRLLGVQPIAEVMLDHANSAIGPYLPSTMSAKIARP